MNDLEDVPGCGLAPGVLSRRNGQSHTRTEVVSLNKRHFECCVDGNASTRGASTNDQNVELGVFIISTRGFANIEILFTRGWKPRWWWHARFPCRRGVRGAGIEEVINAPGDDDGASRGVGEGFAGKKGATEHYGGWWKKCKSLMIMASGRTLGGHGQRGNSTWHSEIRTFTQTIS